MYLHAVKHHTRRYLHLACVGLVLGLGAVPAGADQAEHADQHIVAELPGELLPAYGIKLAMGGTTMQASDDDRMAGVVTQLAAGYSVGPYATVWRYRWLHLQAEFLYSARRVALAQESSGMEATHSLHYLDLPILAQAEIPLRHRLQPFVALGLAPGLLVGARHDRGVDLDGVINRLDLSAVGALGTRFPVSSTFDLTVEARAIYGLTDAYARTSRNARALLLSIGLGHGHRSPRNQSIPSADPAMDSSTQRASRAATPAAPVQPSTAAPKPIKEGILMLSPLQAELFRLDRLMVALAVTPCFTAEPKYLEQVTDLSDLTSLVVFGYRRTSINKWITLSRVRVVSSVWDAPQFEQCLLKATEGLTYSHNLNNVAREFDT
ncbi:MAG: porin family protein, partial [Myxococcota bacterium]